MDQYTTSDDGRGTHALDDHAEANPNPWATRLQWLLWLVYVARLCLKWIQVALDHLEATPTVIIAQWLRPIGG